MKRNISTATSSHWHENCGTSDRVENEGISWPSEPRLRFGFFNITPYPHVLWTLERLIGSSQPVTQAVGNGTSSVEALQKTESLTPDVFVVDANVGREKCLRSISQLKTGSGAKILVLTGLREESMHGDAVLAGAHGAVRTELPAQTILKAIKKVHEGELWLARAATSLVLEQMIRERMGEAVDSDRAKIASLTERERALVALAAHHVSATGKVRARMLDLSKNTVRKHPKRAAHRAMDMVTDTEARRARKLVT